MCIIILNIIRKILFVAIILKENVHLHLLIVLLILTFSYTTILCMRCPFKYSTMCREQTRPYYDDDEEDAVFSAQSIVDEALWPWCFVFRTTNPRRERDAMTLRYENER